uniref:Uncharacterized protein n=1 Tax=Oryza brachyantha TaxID=4533 RepID=J3MPK3_ORYBR
MEEAAAARRVVETTTGAGLSLEVERQLRLHFRRLPARYMADMCGKAEEVMIHRSLLLAVADCSQSHGHGHPQIHARFLKTFHLSFSSRFSSTVHLHDCFWMHRQAQAS